MKSVVKTIAKESRVYIITLLATMLVLTWSMKLWRADLKVPFSYFGDSLFVSMVVKGTVENGWYLSNPYLGAPFGLDLRDFPVIYHFHCLLIKMLSLFTTNYAVLMNVYFLLTFAMTSLAAVVVFRSFQIGVGASVVFALLYTFLPYRFYRGQHHLFLSAYYLVPFMCMVVLWVCSGKNPLLMRSEKGRWRLQVRAGSLASVAICIAIGAGGVYYAFFSCFFLVIAALLSLFAKKNVNALANAVALISIIVCTACLCLSPNLIYKYRKGGNKMVAERDCEEAEYYGLKIRHMFVHAPIRDIEEGKHYPFSNEGQTAYLGLIGGTAFLFLLVSLVFRTGMSDFYRKIAVLNLCALLLGLSGGFGPMFALSFSKIRCYNRIIVFIAFFSLLAGAFFVDAFVTECAQRERRVNMGRFVLALLLLTGLYDQISDRFVPPYRLNEREFAADQAFVERVERKLSPGAMVFQLPYMEFPESGSVYEIFDYGPMRPYLHSKHLKWSYAAMKGRNDWHRKVSAKPLDELLREIMDAGFAGLLIDCRGYSDSGKRMIADLTEKLGALSIVSDNGGMVFFDLQNQY